MRFANKAMVAGGLGFAVSALVGCASSGGLLTTGQAANLNTGLEHVSAAVSSRQCGEVDTAIAALHVSIEKLGSVNQTLVSNLEQGVQTVGDLADLNCQGIFQTTPTTAPTPTTTPTTTITTTKATTTPTTTTKTATTPTTTTKTTPTTPTTTRAPTTTTPTTTPTTTSTTTPTTPPTTTTTPTTTPTATPATNTTGAAGLGGAGSTTGAGNGAGSPAD
ncbi:MAG: hypothetical protein ACLP0J_17410 [Solirubrobacteraceae bacterium]